MRTSSYFGIMALIFAGCFLASGCAGIRIWDKREVFYSQVKDSTAFAHVKKVGIYVFSNGRPIANSDVRLDAVDILDLIVSYPASALTLWTVGHRDKKEGSLINLSKHIYPADVTPGAIFSPDTSNAGPSMELGMQIKSELESRGYDGTLVLDLGHNRPIGVKDCLEHARSHGFDAIFVTHYTGLNSWMKFLGSETIREYSGGRRQRTEVISVHQYSGFLYVPNSALFDVTSGETLWNNSYYGLVERAHLPNLQSEPFNEIVPEALVDNGEEDYVKSASKAVDIIFSPPLWPGTFKEFPSKGPRRKRI